MVRKYLYVFEDWSLGFVKTVEIPKEDMQEVDDGVLEIYDITDPDNPKRCTGGDGEFEDIPTLIVGSGPGGETIPWEQ